MVRVSTGLTPEGMEGLFNRAISAGNRYIYVCYRRVLRFFNRERELELLARSYLVEISALWFALSEPQRQAWRDVADDIGMTGWRLFVSDCSERFNLSLSGVATPSQYHQVRVAYLKIQSPASSIKILQRHPHSYYVKQRISGTQSQYAPVLITESFALPLTIGLNYKSDLTSGGAGSFAKMYARVKSLYQGRNIYTDLVLNLDLSGAWQNAESELTAVLGRAISYEVFIECFNVTGELWFDNPSIVHSGQNWCRDPFCDYIDEIFSYAYRLCLPNWEAVSVPSGASFESKYVDS